MRRGPTIPALAPRMWTLRVLLLLLGGLLLLPACKKEEDKPRGLQAYLDSPQLKRVMYFYGTDPSEINSAVIKESISSGTQLNVQFDDSKRVVRAYLVVNGVPGANLYKFDYSPAGVVVNTFLMNWQTGDATLQAVTPVSRAQLEARQPEATKDFYFGVLSPRLHPYRLEEVRPPHWGVPDLPPLFKQGTVGDLALSLFVTKAYAGTKGDFLLGVYMKALVVLNAVIVVAAGTGGFLMCGGPVNPAAPYCGAVAASLAFSYVLAKEAKAAEPPLPTSHPEDPIIQIAATFPDRSKEITGPWQIVLQTNIGTRASIACANFLKSHTIDQECSSGSDKSFKGSWGSEGKTIQFTYSRDNIIYNCVGTIQPRSDGKLGLSGFAYSTQGPKETLVLGGFKSK